MRVFLPSRLDAAASTDDSAKASADGAFVAELLRKETVGGMIALVAATIAVIWANSPWAGSYASLQAAQLGPLDLRHWAADGALTLFFFMAGLELKRELVTGSLGRIADAAVPVAAAVGGVALPVVIFVGINGWHPAGSVAGWAIPAATDIAFALAVLAVVGANLPAALRAFLLTLAVVDDLIVIVIIAVFFTSQLNFGALLTALALIAAYWFAQHRRVTSVWLYLPLVLGAWWFTHESGVHATIAGVALGLLTRVRPDPAEEASPAHRLEHRLAPYSSALAVPFFALLSAGVAFRGGSALVESPIVWGVVLGLLLGKPIGVLGGAWLVTRVTRAALSPDLTWRDLVGMAALGGIGFTVSLLVADLSFTGEQAELAKAAVLLGSLAAALVGASLLRRRDRVHATPSAD